MITLDDIEQMDCNTLTVKQVADFLGKSPQVIRDQAEAEQNFLGFPICKAGHSYCVPRVGFINWVKGNTPMIGYIISGQNVYEPINYPSVIYGGDVN